MRRARDADFEKKPNLAVEEYQEALRALGGNQSPEASAQRAQALRGIADIYYLELQDLPRAKDAYQRLVQLCPGAPEVQEARIRMADLLQNYFRDPRGAIGELTAVLSRKGADATELRYRIAKLYYEIGDYQQSRLEAHEVAQRCSGTKICGDALFLNAQALAKEGNSQEAIRAYRSLAESNGEWRPRALYEIGKLYVDQGDRSSAIEAWVEALRSHSNPLLVQAAITRARRRLLESSPERVGRAEAFEPPPPGVRPARRKRATPPKSKPELAPQDAPSAPSEGSGEAPAAAASTGEESP